MQSEKTIQIIKSLQLQCDISGKIDGLSFYKWKGKNVVRKIGKPSKPASEAQLECRRKFATLQNLSRIFKPIIRETYNTGKKPLTPANLFIKKNGEIFEKVEKSINPIDTEKTVMLRLSKHEPISKKSWFDKAHHDNVPDYSKIKLTRSNYPIPFTPKLTKHSEELFTLQWDDFTKRYDTIALIIFSPEKEKYDKIEISITENYWHIEIPEEFQETKNYYYLYCYHSKRKTYSESITLTLEDGADILWKLHKQKLSLTVGFNPWSKTEKQDNTTERLENLSPFRREMLRFSLWFPFGCLRPSFDIRYSQRKALSFYLPIEMLKRHIKLPLEYSFVYRKRKRIVANPIIIGPNPTFTLETNHSSTPLSASGSSSFLGASEAASSATVGLSSLASSATVSFLSSSF
ncbi:MAG: hypothetical protein KDK36_19420 [Leptospiraceae bacterium]|nr:hypothetical protein [Leptospiraceae bacterium]